MKKLCFLLIVFVLHSSLFAQVSSIGQVFNFSVGDTFEYYYSASDVPFDTNCSAGYFIIVITSAQQAANNFTYSYNSWSNDTTRCIHRLSNLEEICPLPGSTCISSGTYQVMNTDSAIADFTDIYSWSYGSNAHVCDSPFCTFIIDSTAAYHSRKRSIFNIPSDIEIYVNGIGLALRKYYHEFIPHYQVYDSLIFYSKPAQGEIWGQFVAIDNVSGITETQEVKSELYPNPTSSDFIFSVSEITKPDLRFILFDIAGKEIKRVNINSLKTAVNCCHVSTGIYCWQLLADRDVIGRGKLVVQ